MAKIVKNPVYDATIEMVGENLPFIFVEDDGKEILCKTWLETSKKNDKHPDGKMWIKLPKDNSTNRAYFSLDLFESTNVDGEVEVEVKTTAPRVLGASGVRPEIVKYLDEVDAARYQELVNGAVEKYKAAKATSKKKKVEEMTKEELEAYIECLKTGKNYTAANGSAYKSYIDTFSEDELNEYNELLAKAAETKANAPKAKRGALSDAEKAARKAKRDANELTKAEKLLEALKASLGEVENDEITNDDLMEE